MSPRFLLCWFVLLTASFAAAPARPNLVVFLSDDHSLLDSTVYGAKDIRTPQMQRLAAAGMTLDRAFVASPSCAPSRAALLTGRMPVRNGAEANHSKPRAEIKKLPAYLKELGYEVVSFGKVGHYAQTPEYGFDLARHCGYHEDIAIPNAIEWLNNRRSEFLLRDAEFLAAVAHTQSALTRAGKARAGQGGYPAAEITRLWKLILLNQFHDIIPGSSINQVYADSEQQYADVLSSGAALRDQAVDALVPSPRRGANAAHVLAVNTLSAERTEVVALPEGMFGAQTAADGAALGVVSVPAMGYAVAAPGGAVVAPATAVASGERITLENAYVRAVFDRDGELVSLFDKQAGREAIQPGTPGNHLVLFDDNPLQWDAWDVDVYHLEKRFEDGIRATSAQVTEQGPLRAAVAFEISLSPDSTLRQTVRLSATSARLDFVTEVDWHERHKFLKTEFPFALRAQEATYEIQFGHLQRPTHANTTWDMARFEVSAHKWADLSEPDFGVALLNDCKYGYATQGNVMRLSLLRAPTMPDAEADQGRHAFTYALLPHAGQPQEAGVIEEGYRLNAPLLVRATAAEPAQASFFQVSAPNVVIEAVKKAEDSNALIVRLYESHGKRGAVRLSSPLPFTRAAQCNLLEEDDAPLAWVDGGVDVAVAPFKIVTLKLW